MRLRGTKDFFGEEILKFDHVIERASSLFIRYGCSRIATPIIEYSTLFDRVGEASDVVSKELYTFKDRSNREISLVPEGTASVARAVIENSIEVPKRLFYHGPMFRYERPQKGRYRQFHQIGVEFIGDGSSYEDAELISMAMEFLRSLKIDATLKINYLGSAEGREKYQKALYDFASRNLEGLCDSCGERISKNVMRILDCKNSGCIDILKGAPNILSHLPTEEMGQYNFLKELLSRMGVPFVEDHTLVRGLDYYTNIVFEVSDSSGAAILAGGRYNNLYGEMGKNLPAIGFAAGIERLISLIEKVTTEEPDVAIITVDNKFDERSMILAEKLRGEGFNVLTDYGKAKVKSKLKKALSKGVRYSLFIGEDEVESSLFTLKDLKTAESRSLNYKEIIEIIRGEKRV